MHWPLSSTSFSASWVVRYAGDSSLDGFWGRIGAAAVLGSPLINEKMHYVQCDLDKCLRKEKKKKKKK